MIDKIKSRFAAVNADENGAETIEVVLLTVFFVLVIGGRGPPAQEQDQRFQHQAVDQLRQREQRPLRLRFLIEEVAFPGGGWW